MIWWEKGEKIWISVSSLPKFLLPDALSARWSAQSARWSARKGNQLCKPSCGKWEEKKENCGNQVAGEKFNSNLGNEVAENEEKKNCGNWFVAMELPKWEKKK